MSVPDEKIWHAGSLHGAGKSVLCGRVDKLESLLIVVILKHVCGDHRPEDLLDKCDRFGILG